MSDTRALNLEERLSTLYDSGRSSEAGDLARAVLKNDTVVEVSVDGDVVRVETERFRGRHRVREDGRGNDTVDSEGEYTVKSIDAEWTFGTATIRDEVLETAREELHDEESPAEDVGSAGSEETTGQAEEEPTTEESPAEPPLARRLAARLFDRFGF